MSYNKKNWKTGDIVTQEDINNIENGVYEAHVDISNIIYDLGTATLNTTDKTLKGAINELFQSVSNGKELIASAITDKGIITSNTDTFQQMASNINLISGSGSSTGNVTGKILTFGDKKYTLHEDADGKITATILKLSIANKLTNVSNNNSAKQVDYGDSYSATINVNSGYELSTLTVTMGKVDITSSAVSGNSINISSVTDNVVITATATSSLSITNVNAGTFTTDDTVTITYTTSSAVTKHEYRMQKSYAYTDGTDKVTSDGNNHTMTFNAGDLSAGTKNGSIRVTDADGNTAEADFTLIITENTQTPTTYTITKNLSNCSCSNSATSITSGSSYSATISANSGYDLSSITVTMGGTNITSSAVSGSRISISSVTGNIVITASATQQETPSQPNPPSSGSALDDWDAFHNTYGNYVAYMADRVGVNGKSIRMTATATPTTVQGSVSKDYRSGAMVSKKAFKYGTFTFKFKVSANDTLLWPMIWTLPDQTAAQDQLIGKNQRPEYDLLESWGALTNNSIVQTYHCTTPSGESKMNYLQGRTPVDLTQEHELKLVWAQDNTVKMYCDGVLKVDINEYTTNWQTGEVDYQVWFINLGLGGFDGTAPNGTGWFELIDYDFQPVYTRDRVKQDYGMGNFSDGTLPSGPLPSSSGSGSGSVTPTPTPSTYTVTRNVTNCTSTGSNTIDTSITTTFQSIVVPNDGYTLTTLTVSMGGVDYTNRPNVITDTEWDGKPAKQITIENVNGNIVVTASATQQASSDEFAITSITGGTFNANWSIPYTTNKPVVTHYYSTWYQGSDSATSWTDRTSKVTDNGNNSYSMSFNYSEFVAGTKNPAIKVVDADGNIAIKTFDLTIE